MQCGCYRAFLTGEARSIFWMGISAYNIFVFFIQVIHWKSPLHFIRSDGQDHPWIFQGALINSNSCAFRMAYLPVHAHSINLGLTDLFLVCCLWGSNIPFNQILFLIVKGITYYVIYRALGVENILFDYAVIAFVLWNFGRAIRIDWIFIKVRWRNLVL